MKLLVVVDTLNGSRITWSMASTLSAPDPMPSSPDRPPAIDMMPEPERHVVTWYATAPSGVG